MRFRRGGPGSRSVSAFHLQRSHGRTNWWSIPCGGGVLWSRCDRTTQFRALRPQSSFDVHSEAERVSTNSPMDRKRRPGGAPSRTRNVRPLRSVRQRFASASQLAPSGSSPPLTDRANRARMCFERERRFSVRKSCRSASSGGTTKALQVKRQPQCLGQCRRNRTFSSNIARMASLPVGDTRKGSWARHASVVGAKPDRSAENLVPGSEGLVERAVAGSDCAFQVCSRCSGEALGRQDLHDVAQSRRAIHGVGALSGPRLGLVCHECQCSADPSPVNGKPIAPYSIREARRLLAGNLGNESSTFGTMSGAAEEARLFRIRKSVFHFVRLVWRAP